MAKGNIEAEKSTKQPKDSARQDSIKEGAAAIAGAQERAKHLAEDVSKKPAGLVTLDDDNFDSEVLKARGLTLVFFSAPSFCPSCVEMAPDIHKLVKEYKGKVKMGEYDLDGENNEKVKETYQVDRIPRVALFKDGQPKTVQHGKMSYQELVRFLQPHLSK